MLSQILVALGIVAIYSLYFWREHRLRTKGPGAGERPYEAHFINGTVTHYYSDGTRVHFDSNGNLTEYDGSDCCLRAGG